MDFIGFDQFLFVRQLPCKLFVQLCESYKSDFLCAVEFGYLLVQYYTCSSFSHIFFLFGHQFI